MSKIKYSANPAGTGTFTIASPATNTDRTLTLPDETGTIYTSGSAVRSQKGVPAFSAYQSSAQSIPSTTFTKIQCNTEVFDTASAYDATTNFRFQPAVSGYYQINGVLELGSGTGTALVVFYKNGARSYSGSSCVIGDISNSCTVSALVYFNGSTDYLELWGYQSNATALATNPAATVFNGILIAAA